MRIWIRTSTDRHCGLCWAPIATGDPVLQITIAGVHHVLARCVACAGPAPELPPLVPSTPIEPLPFARFTPAMLPLDWKQKQAGHD